MARKILLAHPRFPENTFWSFDRALGMAGRSATMPPLGLLTLAGLFPEDSFDLKLADENIREISDESLREADMVLASAMIVQQESLARLVDRCRRLGTPVMVGGPLVSSCFEILRGQGLAPDVWFLGEAERLFPDVLRDLDQGHLRHVYAHVATEERAQQVRQVFGEEAHVLVEALPQLDLVPLPRFDLLELEAYHSMAIQASRGCPIGCEFCDIWVQYGRKARTAPAQHLLQQLDSLKSLEWRGRVFVVDDNFIGNVAAAKSLATQLCKWQEENGRPFSFSTEADVRLGSAKKDMTELRVTLATAGFGGVFLGLESPSREALAETGKRVNIDTDGDVAQGLLERVHRLQAAGLEVKAGFILGFDQDPSDIDQAMIDFVSRSAIPLAMVGTLGVLPGTALQTRLKREGRYRGRLVGTQTHGFSLNYRPKGRSEHAVLEQYARVLDALYGNRMQSYYARCEDLMQRLPGPPRTGDRAGLRSCLALLRSFWTIRPRVSYLLFLGRTLLRRPRSLPYAVVLATQGEHLHRLTREAIAEYRARRPGRCEHDPDTATRAMATER
ncbi:MAG: radical SAM superfamily enzyme YgiQ (UPF0313 family) [Candidatus Paceibacteria bacterium]|jgi:radical SAM superfamily enzyme YgiQ (UPF0313 family)